MLPFAPVTVCTLCYCITFAEKLFQKREKKWIKLGQKWLCNAILHVDMQMVRKKHSFSIVKDSKWGKKNKMLLNLYTSLLDFFWSFYEIWQEIIQTRRNPTSWFTALRWSLPSLPAKLGVEPLQHVITSYCRLANIYWLWHISTAGDLLANPDLCLNIHVIYLYWQVQTKHDCDGNQKYHLSKSYLLPESILFSRSNITI